MLGFGEGEGREIEKREDRQESAFWRKKKVGFVFIRFWKRFFFAFIFLVLEKFFFFNILLTWKIVRVSEALVLYIDI